MKNRPMIGSFALEGVEYIESSESRALAEHRVPGLAGNYLQDMGSDANAIVIAGTRYGDDQRDDFLKGIRDIFNKGEPTTFVADINTATDVTQVMVEDLRVAEVGGSTDTFHYVLQVRKYTKPPEPPAGAGLLDSSLLDDALGTLGAMDLLDNLVNIPGLADPSPPLKSAMGGVKSSTGGLGQVTSPLKKIFGMAG